MTHGLRGLPDTEALEAHARNGDPPQTCDGDRARPGERFRLSPPVQPVAHLQLAVAFGIPDSRIDAQRTRRRWRPSDYSGSVTSTAPKPASGPSTKKISIVMSGSTWAWLRNARTLRPVSSSTVPLIALGHHALKVLAHGDDPFRLAAVHDRLLERGEAAAAHHDDDDVVERVGLGLHRTAPVVLAQDARRCWLRSPPADARRRAALPRRRLWVLSRFLLSNPARPARPLPSVVICRRLGRRGFRSLAVPAVRGA